MPEKGVESRRAVFEATEPRRFLSGGGLFSVGTLLELELGALCIVPGNEPGVFIFPATSPARRYCKLCDGESCGP